MALINKIKNSFLYLQQNNIKKMKKNTKMIGLLVALKNSLAPETKNEVVAAFDAAIAEAEAMTADVTKEELIAMIEDKMKGLVSASDMVALQNSIEERFKIKNTNEYLGTKKALKDFYNVIKNSNSRDSFRNAWADVCRREIKNDIDPSGVLLPNAVVTAITDKLAKAGKLFSLLNQTGLKAIKVPVNAMAEDAETSRAARHTKGQTKAAQVWDLSPKTLTAQAIFKLLPVDYETLRQAENEAQLVNYIVSELTNAWIAEVERAILVGDGRATSDARHISSFETLTVAASTDFITVVGSGSPAVITMELARQAVDAVETEGRLVMVISKANKTVLAKQIYGTGGTTQYLSDDVLAAQLGVSEIITNKNVTAANGALAIVVDVDAYAVVGDTSPEQINQYDIYKNQNVFEMVGVAGGGLTKFKSAAVVTA